MSLIWEVAAVRRTISFWESTLFHDKFLMSPSSVVLVEDTLKLLKAYESKLQEELRSQGGKQ